LIAAVPIPQKSGQHLRTTQLVWSKYFFWLSW